MVEPENLELQHVLEKEKGKKEKEGLHLESKKGRQEAF